MARRRLVTVKNKVDRMLMKANTVNSYFFFVCVRNLSYFP